MLVIRREQMIAFERAAVRRFEIEAREHASTSWPIECAVRGDAGVRELVARAVAQGARYGIAQREAVLGYLDLMFALGDDFDSDPALPWAARILTDAAAADVVRIDMLVEMAVEHLRQRGL